MQPLDANEIDVDEHRTVGVETKEIVEHRRVVGNIDGVAFASENVAGEGEDDFVAIGDEDAFRRSRQARSPDCEWFPGTARETLPTPAGSQRERVVFYFK